MCFLQLCYKNPAITMPVVEKILNNPDKGLELVQTLRRINDPNPPEPETTTPAGATAGETPAPNLAAAS